MSASMENIRFRLSLEFIFAVDDRILNRRLSRDHPLSPRSRRHTEAIRSRASLAHLAAILGRDQPEVTQNPDPRLLDTHVPQDRNDLHESKWNALEAPQLLSPAGVLRKRRGSHALPANHHVVGVELLSPYFTFTEWQHAQKTITRILVRLNPIEPPTISGSTHRGARCQKHTAGTNERCSFRLQYAPLDNGDHFQLRTLQNLIAIWGSFESEIEKLHPLHHRSASHGPLSLWNNMQRGTTGTQFRHEVYTATTLPDLQDIFEFDREEAKFSKISYKTHPAFSPSVTHCHAVEFREHAGTLNVRDVLFWIGFTAAVTGLCQELTDEGDVFDLEETIDLMRIMEVLKASYQAEQYAWNRLIRMAEREKRVRSSGFF